MGPIFFLQFRYKAKKQHIFGLDLRKISICGDILETLIFEEF